LRQCIGFRWQGFGRRQAAGVAYVRRHQKLPQCMIEPVPAREGGGASVITYYGRGKN